ncbi:glutamine synthetase family protein [Streptomyces sp. B-S-A8]|uniref:Glutamine synthetase family protein n=1 Tax=Streptomyces solicavernae TaxID=3043614 RepID=A0ABT6RQK0_9ACTN|nr:glutamine synthetase family protein [Streptomyces sp. B-S-A8]MDI3386720.1 glutamine synthetase family protein [Streptomyces sp. B-S-A8]
MDSSPDSSGHHTQEPDLHLAPQAVGLTERGVHGVALTWVDNAGLTRAKTVPLARLAHAAARGVGMSPVFDVYLVDDSMTSSRHTGGPDGDLRLVPDLDRLTALAAQPGWAWAPVDRFDQRGGRYPGCQRHFARRMADRAAERGLRLRMGFETEWVVTQDGAPAATGPGYGMTRLVELSAYADDLLTALAAQGLDVLQLHPEYAPGQFEVSVAPSDPVGAADEAVLVRETIRAMSLTHGLTPAFGPAVTPRAVGNGRHLHLSLWEGERNLCAGGDGPFGMTRRAESFLAGILTALPELLAVGAPSPASHLRLEPSRWAGAFHCWGLENREAALRFITGAPDDPAAANAEVKCFDPAANPYLVVGSVLAAGLAALDSDAALPMPVSGDPADQGQPRLPTSLTQSLARFEGSTVLREAMGDELFEAFAAVRAAEAELFAGHSPEELVAETRERY